MAVAADYSGWVRELEHFEANNGDDDSDARYESSRKPPLTKRGIMNTRGSISKVKSTRVISQTEELQQEMKLLHWHKLANEAALKAAIIKTNKIKQEDSQLSSSLTYEEMEQKQQRIQQIIEEEQLRPLEVNSEFFRDFNVQEQHDQVKMETEVQRHIDHLKKLKETMVQREEMQQRRQKYRQGIQELQGGSSTCRNSNQDEERQTMGTQHSFGSNGKRTHHGASLENDKNKTNTEVLCSLDKLMELEKRIRHLEDAGLGLDDDPRVECNMNVEMDGLCESNRKRQEGAGAVRFAKRKSNGKSNEPSKTVYAVKTINNNNTSVANKMRARETGRHMPATTNLAKKRLLTSNRPPPTTNTFLTSLPESKQRQLRRMSERERRNYLKREKANEAKEKSAKQDVVIDDWLDKKRQAAQNRKIANNQILRTTGNGSNSATVSGTARHGVGKPLPPPPKVRVPTVGAASGKRISNPHLQKFDNIKKGFQKRNEALSKAPTNVTKSDSILSSRQSGGHFGKIPGHASSSNRNPPAEKKWGSTLPSSSFSSSLSSHENGKKRNSSSTKEPYHGNNYIQSGKLQKSVTAKQTADKLPVISRRTEVPAGTNKKYSQLSTINQSHQSTTISHAVSNVQGVSLPRLLAQGKAPLPSPPPLAMKNANTPQFSRLHKR